MGYNTDFIGTFSCTPISSKVIEALKEITSDVDLRRPDSAKFKTGQWAGTDMTYIDLEVEVSKRPDDSVESVELFWPGCEKSYDMCQKLNLIVDYVRTIEPTFKLDGVFTCQGEDMDDRYYIKSTPEGHVEIQSIQQEESARMVRVLEDVREELSSEGLGSSVANRIIDRIKNSIIKHMGE